MGLVGVGSELTLSIFDLIPNMKPTAKPIPALAWALVCLAVGLGALVQLLGNF